jgi:hypothetical protein
MADTSAFSSETAQLRRRKLNETTDEPYVAAVQNLPPALVNNPTLMEGDCYCLRTYREGDLAGAANVNVVTCSRLKALIDGTDGLRCHASIPLYASHNTRLGVLNVASEDWRELSADDLRLLYTGVSRQPRPRRVISGYAWLPWPNCRPRAA